MHILFLDHDTISFGAAIATVMLGVLLLAMKIPYSNKWKSLRQVRVYLAISYFILAAANLFSSVAEISSNGTLSSLEIAITIVVLSLQALLFAITNLVFIRSSYVKAINICINIAVIGVVGTALFLVLYYFTHLFSTILPIVIVAYYSQLIYYYILFRKEYKICVERLEAHYDEEEDERLHWIKTCIYSALIIGIFITTALIFPLPIAVYDCFTLVGIMYYAYIVSRIYNYRVEARFLLEAISEDETAEEEAVKIKVNTSSLSEKPRTLNSSISATQSKEVDKLEQELKGWVQKLRYIEKDVSIDETATELGVTRNFLSSYFTTHKSTNFRTWRLELRIHEAERILKNEPAISVSELFDIVGFSDRSNFYRHFTRLVGKTPAEYKKIYAEYNL